MSGDDLPTPPRYDPRPWVQRAACRGLPVNMFFPRGRLNEEVLAICAGCPVRGECRLAGVNEHGIWGGR